ncbi:hypothetical protein K439DRAFT_1617971 [Ramaria rubella]|nr:hypothetical protein K439DRAFT_1617971 [Ramaria rubella]
MAFNPNFSPVALDEKYETTSMTADYPSFDKHSATMPAFSPMSGFAAHGLAPQPRRQTGRCRRLTVGYLATVITPVPSVKSRTRASMPSSSPPSISKLRREFRGKREELESPSQHARDASLVRFLSLSSPSLSAAAGLMYGGNMASSLQ